MDVLLTKASTLGPIGPTIATFILGLASVILLYCYSTRNHNYWKKLGVPYLQPTPFIGSIFSTKPLQDLECERYKKLGRIYGHYEGNTALLSVAEPELLRCIFVKDFQTFTSRRDFTTEDKIMGSMIPVLQGEDWRRVRGIVSPTFTTGKIRKTIGIFKDCSRTLVKNFKLAAEKVEYVEVKTIYGAFTMDVIASSAFSTKIDSHNDPNNEFVRIAREAIGQNINWRMILFFLAPGLMKFFKISLFPPKLTSFFGTVTKHIIEERKRTGQTRNDFLQLLLDTAKELQEEGKLDIQDKENDITENYGTDESKDIFKSDRKKTLSFNELVAQCVIFFVAGYATTAATLSLISHCLAVNPDVQERLIQEIDDVLKENNGELTYEAVQGLKTLDNVISETLRLYSSAIRLERLAGIDYKLGDTGINIPKGMVITIPIHAMHRDPEHFPDPEKFDPDRFTEEERSKRHPYAYMPFGVGPRNCVGMRFALIEIKVCMVYVLSNFRIKRCSETKDPLEFNLGIGGLLQPKDINVMFEIRRDSVKAL